MHWMCCLLHLWTLVRTLVKCICLLSDKFHDDVIDDVMLWADDIMVILCCGPNDVMDDVMVMSCMMS